MGDVNCLRCKYRHTDNGNCTAVGGFCTAVPAAHCPLLRQYLDTGMTPEAFQSFVVFLQDLIGNQKASEALDRFRQLVKADKDGRLVVRPCKMGDTLFRVFAGEILEHKVRNMRYLAIQERWDIDTTPFCPYVASSSRTKSTEQRPCGRRRSVSSRADRSRSTRTLSSTGWETRIVPTAEKT